MLQLESFSGLIMDVALKATALLAFAVILSALLRRGSAATRHMSQALFMGALLLLPFSVKFLPAWHVRGLPQLLQPRAAATSTEQTPLPWTSPSPGGSPVRAQSLPVARDRGRVKNGTGKPVEQQATAPKTRQTEHQFSDKAPARAVNPLEESRTSQSSRESLLMQSTSSAKAPASWLEWLALGWLAGAIFLLMRSAHNVVRLRRLVKGAVPVQDPHWLSLAQQTTGLLGVRQRVLVLASPDTDVPLAAGILRPAVILPIDHQEWPAARRSTILLHEIAHIRRRDALAHALAQLVTALYWFHPLAWWMERTMRAERERACDDQVLASGAKASEYAHQLLTIVSSLRQPHLAAALAMARRSQLEGRVLAILDPKMRRGSVSGKAAFALSALVLALALPIAAIRPAQQPAPPKAKSSPPKASPAVPATPAPEGEQPGQGALAEEPGAPAEPQQIDVRGLEQLQEHLSEMTQRLAQQSVLIGEPPAQRQELEKLQEQLGLLEEQLQSRPTPPPTDEEREAEARALLQESEAVSQARAKASANQAAEQAAAENRLAELRALLAAEEAKWQNQAPVPPVPPASPASPAPPAAPASPVPPAPLQGDLSVCGGKKARLHQMNMESHNGYKHWTATWSGDDCSVELRSEGEIQFNADMTAIESISSGGYFEVNVREGATLRQIRVSPSGSGLQYVYKVNGSQQPFEGEAKTWFANFLLSLERATGLAAETRVPALLAKGGPAAVLDEIGNLQGDYVRGIYFRKLLDQPNLPPAIVVRVISQAGHEIASDYELGRVLMEVSRQYRLNDETSRTAFLTAADRLKSDYEHSRVLIELLRRPDISSENVRMALNSAAGIKSDYEKSRILLALLGQSSFQPSYLDSYLKLAASIHSDYEKSRDLLATLKRFTMTADAANQILAAAEPMTSDYEKSRVLTGLAAQQKFDEKETDSYLNLVDSMKSDYERSRSLMALLEHNKLSDQALGKVIESVPSIGNDYEKARVLQAIAARYTLQGALRESFIKAAESINGEYERGRALAGVVRRATL
jgi:beta-lactamase regulating signal transducer with metallopeptidase domain